MAVVRNIVVRVGADISDLQKGLSAAQRSMSSVGKTLSAAGKTLATSLTLPVLALGAAIGKAGTDFEQGMSNIKAVSGATADEMKSLHDLSLLMGKDTAFSAKEAASGIEELIKAGVSVTDIING